VNRCVLFDFDGTLNDTWRLYLESFRRSLEPRFNRLLSDAEIIAYQPSAERRLLRTLVEEPNFTRYFESFLAHYTSLHETHNDGPYPGVHEMLADLRAQGYRLGIVTGKSQAAWNLTFEKSGLGAFDVVITDNDVTHPKPHPEGLSIALKALCVPVTHAFYIGDSLLDMSAALLADIPFGAALWSKSANEQEAFRAAAAILGVVEYFTAPSMVAARLAACHQEGFQRGATRD
jgi:pyrophosphatase PpaX